MIALGRIALAAAAVLAIGSGLNVKGIGAAELSDAAAFTEPAERIVALRRLTEAQYRNSIADIFGPEIAVAGRFEPIVRPIHELISSGAAGAAISPAGLEQFDAMARNIAVQVFDAKHRGQFVPCTPKVEVAADPACAEQTLAPLGRYLFRRPLTAPELAFYGRLANQAAAATGSFHKGLELALATMLVSPNFLYIVETARPDPNRPGDLVLDDWSRAARLSFLLWNSTPNEALLTTAAQGRLSDDAELARFAERMVGSPRFEAGVRAFFADMLLFEKFDALAKDAIVYPYFNSDVAKALPEQLLRTIVDQVLTRDGDYRDLFTTNRTFMNRPLASLYQVRVPASAGWVPYEFPPEAGRSGLLGQAGFLALYSHSGRSSPTLRGRAVRELLLCQPVPDPPGNVNFTAVQDTTNTAMPTARIRLSAHATDPVCKGCHAITDPLGLSFEKFDGAGMFRTVENGAPIDDEGAMDGAAFFGVAGLGQAMAQNPAAGQCVAGRALEYASGHAVDQETDRIEALAGKFAAQGYKIRALFREVAASPDSYRIRSKPIDAGATRVSMNKAEQSNGL
ncbi:MAG: DUF1592 domain-containing protein [Novosphingobium sp.]|nr:DUF1592 domain-containing protein [Novosphingobium sp.]